MAKIIEQLRMEQQKIEKQITQEKHKKQRLENRAAYYEKGDRRKRAHHLITPWGGGGKCGSLGKGFDRNGVLHLC